MQAWLSCLSFLRDPFGPAAELLALRLPVLVLAFRLTSVDLKYFALNPRPTRSGVLTQLRISCAKKSHMEIALHKKEQTRRVTERGQKGQNGSLTPPRSNSIYDTPKPFLGYGPMVDR